MYLSYSGFVKLDSCAFSYWLSYWHNLDTGVPDDRLGSVFGSTVGRLFERFYAEKAWKSDQPQGLVKSWAAQTLDDILLEEVSPRRNKKGGVLLWGGLEGASTKAYSNREHLLDDVLDSVDNGFRIIRKERLLGPRAEAEVKLDSTVSGHRVGGRADFIIERMKPHDDLVIVDGKGSAYGAKYVDKTQLLWYAMLLREKEGHLPDRVGFVFWKLPLEESSVWYEVTRAETDALLQKILTTIETFEAGQKTLGGETEFSSVAEVFKKNPNEENCKFCPYALEAVCPCPEGFVIADKLRKKALKSKRRNLPRLR